MFVKNGSFFEKRYYNIFMILRWLSCLVGFIAYIRMPRLFSVFVIKVFCFFYNIDASEAEKGIDSYKSLGEFFSRRLREGLRPLGKAPLHPVDGKIFGKGLIEKEGFFLQAKSLVYSAESFLKEALTEDFYGGFYINYYLAPYHYHRVHSPVKGRVKKIKTVSGSVWPVRPYFMENVSDLLIRNKRLLFFIEEFETKKNGYSGYGRGFKCGKFRSRGF